MQEGLYNDADFQSLTPMELVSKTVPELRTIIQDRRERREEERQQMMERLAQARHICIIYTAILILTFSCICTTIQRHEWNIFKCFAASLKLRQCELRACSSSKIQGVSASMQARIICGCCFSLAEMASLQACRVQKQGLEKFWGRKSSF